MSRVVGLRRGVGARGRQPTGAASAATLLDTYFAEYWLASQYSGSGSWLGEKGVADLALPGGSANPTFCGHSTSTNPFGAGVDYVVSPGTTNNYISTPDAAALDIVGDITIIGWVAPNDWTRTTIYNTVGSKWRPTGNQRSYAFQISPTGTLDFYWSTNGTAVSGTNSTASVGFTDGTARYVAVTLDVNNGAGGYDLKFWTSTTGAASSWTQLGTTIVGGATTSIFAGTSALEAGSLDLSGANNSFDGSIARMQVYSGLRDLNAGTGGTLVADFNPAAGTFGTTETTLTGTGDSLTWTINRSTSGRRAYAITRDAWWFGTDDYLSTPDNANFDFGASQDFTVAALFRAIQDADSDVNELIVKRNINVDTEAWNVGLTGSGSSNEFFATVRTAGASTQISDATWNNPGQLQTHIFTRTAGATGTLTLYTDAVSVGGAGAVPGDLANGTALNVGRDLTSGVGAGYFDGLIYGLGISRTGLDAAQVVTLDTELRSLA